MKGNAIYHQIIQKRLGLILDLIREGKDLAHLERETALLVLDVVNAIQKKEFSIKDGCNCFAKIEYALDRKIRERLSEEFEDLLYEAIILDEAGTKFGPDLNLMLALAARILTRRGMTGRLARSRAPAFLKA